MLDGPQWLTCVCFRYFTRIRCCGWLLGLTCLLSAPCGAQEARETNAAPIQWRTGADLKKHLEVVTSVQWQDAELRSRLQNLAAVQRVAIFLDRRIDPQQKIDLSITGVKLDALLEQLAQQVNAATCPIDSVLYVGPPRTAAALWAVMRQRRKEVSRQAALARARPERWSWDELAEPRQLLVDLLRRHQLSAVNPDAIPHDLWPAADLPPLGLADRLTLLLAGFDLTFELSGDGQQVRLVPLPTDVEYEQAYLPVGDLEQAIASLKRAFPGIAVRRDGSQVIVRGGYDDHQRIARQIGGKVDAKTEPVGTNTKFTLTVKNESAGRVVNTVAKRLGRQLQCSPSVREKLIEKVNVTVTDVSLDEVMKKTLEPLGLTYRLTKEGVEVVEK